MNSTTLFQILAPLLLLGLGALALAVAMLAAWRIHRARRLAARGRLWPFALVAMLLVFLACGAGLGFVGVAVGLRGKSVPEWSDRWSSPQEEILRRHCAPFVDEGKSVGLVVAVVSGDETCLMGFGRTSLTTGGTVNGDTLFEIGSITKTFTGLLLATEIQRGRLRLDQPIADLLPAGMQLPEAARGVTLKHLITHTSGLPRLPGNSAAMMAGALGMLLYGGDPYASLSESDYLRALENVKLESAPGGRPSYSNFGVTLLGWLIARNAARDYEEMVRSEICGPLGMAGSAFNLSAEQQRDFATGYRALWKGGPFLAGLRSRPWTNARNLEAAGGLRSNGWDMLAYLQANMQPSNSPLDGPISQSHQKLIPLNRGGAQAMGWVVSEMKKLKATVLWHNGGTGGFRSFIGFDEACRHGVVVLSNSAESVDPLALKILQTLLEQGAPEGSVPGF